MPTADCLSNVNGSAKRIVVAGGGTGGHLFPGIAVAQGFMSKNPNNRVVFISSGNDFEKSALSRVGFELLTIPVSGIKGRGIKNQFTAMMNLPKGLTAAMGHLKRFKPDLVICMGSYSAGPVALGAWFLGSKIVLHEQNLLPGITNRIISRFASRIYLSFEGKNAGMNPKKIRFSGNPVRSEFFDEKSIGVEEVQPDEHIEKPFTVMIVGGSQGAHSINLAVMEALFHIREKGRFRFVHQTGKMDEAIIRAAYEKAGINSVVSPFFDDMGYRYRNADLLICRSGATTVAEITAMGKASILIPYPYAADDHQSLNAKALDDAGAAEMVPEQHLSGSVLAHRIEHYATHPEILVDMENLARKHGRPDAAMFIVNDCYQFLETLN
jgi:UDP-N-acetylglucosamine--N-acetylmuramyl-(pentapeptide) pyrophosphoryl-undecaprenol N-acetylglucosamine transferase